MQTISHSSNGRLRSRAIRIVEPDYRLCRWCKSVWNIGRDECPPELRSMKEVALALDEAKATA